mmetsp:Transcript_34384/g.76375  ORF Transcript_34384/g.76375 Transcript_34384/m.76375 type:complete len:111 (+) Transcript_34384:711-1043(+)
MQQYVGKHKLMLTGLSHQATAKSARPSCTRFQQGGQQQPASEQRKHLPTNTHTHMRTHTAHYTPSISQSKTARCIELDVQLYSRHAPLILHATYHNSYLCIELYIQQYSF